jgi:acyl dehydratase
MQLAGTELGVSDWLQIDQADVDTFAVLTDDEQWIHVDVDRAAQSPFGGTIVHGYLTLASVIRLVRTLVKVDGYRYGLNYGLNKVRFPAPLPVGSRIRVSSRILTATEVSGNGTELVVLNTFEREGSEKPVCVAETVTRYYW